MRQAAPAIPALLDELEKFHGRQEPCWPVDSYEFILWWQCGYPASDAACIKGWKKLKSDVGTAPHELLEAAPRKLAAALKPGRPLQFVPIPTLPTLNKASGALLICSVIA
jgi:hypothetical protein